MFDDCGNGFGDSVPSDRRLNLIQLLALSLAIGVAAGLLIGLAGFGWVMALLAGWAASICAALGVSAVVLFIDACVRAPLPRRAELPDGDDIDAMFAAWDDDLLRDQISTFPARRTRAPDRGTVTDLLTATRRRS